MSFFKQNGTLAKGAAVLTNGAPSATVFTTNADEFFYCESIVITTTDATAETITLSDGTTVITYVVGGSASNVPVIDQCEIPIRWRKGATVTATASAVTSGKQTNVAVRGLVSKT